MDQIKCVIGTNSWGSRAYEKTIRGSYVKDSVIEEAVDKALEMGLDVFDTADDYGFGYAQKLLGRFGETRKLKISAKYTPMGQYKPGQIHKAFEKQCAALKTDFIEYYWLHLPNDIDENLTEIIDLYKHGKIGNIGVSNFNLQEAKHAKEFLDAHNVPLYGVQNHFSLLDREEEKSGMLSWCRENHIAFWGWAVLEEGILTGNQKGRPISAVFGRKTKKLDPLFRTMQEIGSTHNLSAAQVAVTYCIQKGVIPICGCRKPYQTEQLAQDVKTVFSEDEMSKLELAADQSNVKILRSDIFRFAVHSQKTEGNGFSSAQKGILVAGTAAVLAGIGLKILHDRKK